MIISLQVTNDCIIPQVPNDLTTNDYIISSHNRLYHFCSPLYWFSLPSNGGENWREQTRSRVTGIFLSAYSAKKLPSFFVSIFDKKRGLPGLFYEHIRQQMIARIFISIFHKQIGRICYGHIPQKSYCHDFFMSIFDNKKWLPGLFSE